MKTLHIVRGWPGSGKSTLANKLVEPSRICEADQFFTWDGEYHYDQSQIKHAHRWCQSKAAQLMCDGTDADVAVANTFTKAWEYEWYLTMAGMAGYAVRIHACNGDFPNVHGVPEHVVQRMKANFEV